MDNASNNITFLQAVQAELAEKSINFNSEDKHVRCLAHVMNLAAQQVLVTLKAIEGNEPSNENNGLIHKVDFFFLFFYFLFLYLINN
jgi:hypothetical protein